MTPEQRNRLESLVYPMKVMARRKVAQNAYFKAWNDIEQLEAFLRWPDDHADPDRAPEEWISIAEKAAEGHDKTKEEA